MINDKLATLLFEQWRKEYNQVRPHSAAHYETIVLVKQMYLNHICEHGGRSLSDLICVNHVGKWFYPKE